jgi:predicted acylesterase/phospholipase RssA
MLGLVLGGGAAKGYAHIGALKVLEEMSIKPQIIVGASMGALVGGFAATGFKTQQLEEMALSIDKKKKKWLFRIHLSKRGFIDGNNIVKLLNTYVHGKRIEELPVKYACVATDIEESCQIVIDKGNLVKAIRASISIPGVFMPYKYAGRVLVDGGFVNPVPVAVAQDLGADKIIAVNVLRKVDYRSYLLTAKTARTKDYNIKQVLIEWIDYATSQLIDYEFAKIKNALLININTRGIGLSHFEKAREAISRGYEQTQNLRKELEKYRN